MFDPLAIICALAFGMLAHFIGLPALIGYLAAGFVLHEFGVAGGPLLEEVADIGLTLLLFGIGLKLRPADLLKPRVWGPVGIHMLIAISFFLPLLLVATSLLPGIAMQGEEALLIAFALSFSSTVFVIQVLQGRGEMPSRHASLSIGILLIQDIAAVLFIAGSTGIIPDWTALSLLLLIPLRPLILRLLSLAGHGELFTLLGLALALGSAELFETVGIKGDLGALILGALLAGERKAKELAKNLLHFKDLFLVGFFVNIGLSGWPGAEMLYIAVLLGLLAPLKSPLYFWLMTRFHTPPRTALLGAATLGNYSEFGLIVIAIAAKEGLLPGEWSAAFSLTIAIGFLLSSLVNVHIHDFYYRWHEQLQGFQSGKLSRHRPDMADVEIVVLGMGNIGTGTYLSMRETHGQAVLGVDDNDTKLAHHLQAGRRVVAADANDPSFWAEVDMEQLQQVMLALTNHEENKAVGKLLREMGYNGPITAIIRFPDEEADLRKYGISSFNLYEQAGSGFAAHADAFRSDAEPDEASAPTEEASP